jgi:hypothetical protein
MNASGRRDRLEQFAEMAMGPREVIIIDCDGREIDRAEVKPGRLDGGWIERDGDGRLVSHGEMFKNGDGPLETITCERHE